VLHVDGDLFAFGAGRDCSDLVAAECRVGLGELGDAAGGSIALGADADDVAGTAAVQKVAVDRVGQV
jgi:hypothetical protein